MTDPTTPRTSRRALLATGGLVVVAASGCAQADPGGPAIIPNAAADEGPATGNSPAALSRTSAIPVGGGVVFAEDLIVVTQPKAGTFRGFTAVCTHLGCTVNDVSGGTINCACHGSRYRIDNGAVVQGPATEPLAPRELNVAGGQITQG